MRADWDKIIAVSGLIIALATFIWNLFQDRTLKKQQAKLNEIALSKARYEEELKISAKIDIRLVKMPGNNRLIVENNGHARAHYVSIAISPDVCNMHSKFPFPIDMESGQSIPISIGIGLNGPQKIIVTAKWKDDFHKDIQQERQFCIPLFS